MVMLGMTKSKPKSKAKLTRRTLIRCNGAETYEELVEAAKGTKAPKGAPTTLKLREIHVAPNVFQWRLAGRNVLNSEDHVLYLARVLLDAEAGVSPLPAVLVYLIGDRYFVLDGHHRLDAYHSVKWKHSVPVKVFSGTLEQARLKALKENHHNKLPMTHEDKSAAAWELTKTTELSKEQVHTLAAVSIGTVGNMRRVWKLVQASCVENGRDPMDLTWSAARMMEHGKLFPTNDDWKSAQIEKLTEILLEHAGFELTQHPDITAKAIRKLSPELPAQLIAEWTYDEQGAIEQAFQELREPDAEF